MSQIRRVDIDHKKVVESWKELCTTHVAYFETYIHATKRADQMMTIKPVSRKLSYGQPCFESDIIGEWCQGFWFALTDNPSIRTTPFFLVCDIVEWYMDGEDE